MRALLNGNGFDAGSVSRVRVLATIDCQHKTARLRSFLDRPPYLRRITVRLSDWRVVTGPIANRAVTAYGGQSFCWASVVRP